MACGAGFWRFTVIGSVARPLLILPLFLQKEYAMNETKSCTASVVVMNTVGPAIAALVNMVAANRVGDNLPQAIVLGADEAEPIDISNLTVREARIRITGRKPGASADHFVWLNFDRLDAVKGTSVHFTTSQGEDRSVEITSQDAVPGLFVRTNDGEPGFSAPSYYGSTPATEIENLTGHICGFLADELRELDSVDLLVQVSVDGAGASNFPTNLVTDSNSGWASIKRQPVLFTD
jgi:hypothetical protein